MKVYSVEFASSPLRAICPYSTLTQASLLFEFLYPNGKVFLFFTLLSVGISCPYQYTNAIGRTLSTANLQKFWKADNHTEFVKNVYRVRRRVGTQWS